MPGLSWLVRSLLLAVTAAALLADDSDAQVLTFRYDPRYTAGVSGFIRVRYEPTRRHPNRAVIVAELDVSRVSERVLARLGCERDVTQYAWGLYTKWTSRQSSASLDECARGETGGRYDPDGACGPRCSASGGRYECTPSRYREDPRACQQGDLSGKLGNLVVGERGRISGRWEDPYFPAFADVSSQWNIVLRPVCGRKAPRFACAVATKRGDTQD